MKHVAIILDGNRRWAEKRKSESFYGHYKGAQNIQQLGKYILNTEVEVLSLYCFSIENFKRNKEEIKYLMDLFVKNIRFLKKTIKKGKVQILFSGRLDLLPKKLQVEIQKITELNNPEAIKKINICMAYGSQQELVDAAKKIAVDYKDGKIQLEELDSNNFTKYLYQDLPMIDILIRTSGEVRLSNFLLYQLAYAELFFVDCYFPDFDEKEYDKVIKQYQNRNRRFGG